MHASRALLHTVRSQASSPFLDLVCSVFGLILQHRHLHQAMEAQPQSPVLFDRTSWEGGPAGPGGPGRDGHGGGAPGGCCRRGGPGGLRGPRHPGVPASASGRGSPAGSESGLESMLWPGPAAHRPGCQRRDFRHDRVPGPQLLLADALGAVLHAHGVQHGADLHLVLRLVRLDLLRSTFYPTGQRAPEALRRLTCSGLP